MCPPSIFSVGSIRLSAVVLADWPSRDPFLPTPRCRVILSANFQLGVFFRIVRVVGCFVRSFSKRWFGLIGCVRAIIERGSYKRIFNDVLLLMLIDLFLKIIQICFFYRMKFCYYIMKEFTKS